MKQQNFFKSVVLILTTVVLFSCSSSGGDSPTPTPDPTPDPDPNPVTSITLESNHSTIEMGRNFTFIVRNNNNGIVTSQSKIYIDDVEIEGYSFTPSSTGDYTATAKYEALTSSSLALEVTVAPVVTTSDKTAFILGETIIFTSLTNGGDLDVTSDTVYSVDGAEITGNQYTPTERAAYIMTAVYNGEASNDIDFEVGFSQKILVEDYTGTWCGHCPRLAYNLEQAEDQSEDVYGVAIHNGSTDPMVASNYEAVLSDAFGVTGYPAGRINRTVVWGESVSQILNARGINSTLGLGLETSLTGTSIAIDVKVGYITATSDMKLVVYLLEDGKVFPQRNYNNTNSSSPWYQAGDPIQNYRHNNILRKAFTDVFGDAIPNGSVGGEHTRNFTVEMPSNVEDTSKIQIVAFVVDSTDKAINAMRVDLGDSQDYQ